MTRNEFRKRLDQLREVIYRGLAYYAVWEKLALHDQAAVTWTLEEQNQLLGRFRGLFTPAGLALRDMSLMEFAKVFDKRRGTASLFNLLSAARQDGTLVPGRQPTEVDDVSRQLRQKKNLLKRLRRRRNRWLAHVDANPGPVDQMMSQEIQSLAEEVKLAFNWLSTAHDGSVVSWDRIVGQSEAQTTEVLRILREEMRRKHKEHEETLVRIVLDEIRRMEMTMGRRLDGEELQSVKMQFGLTEEQMKRVEKRSGLS